MSNSGNNPPNKFIPEKSKFRGMKDTLTQCDLR